jgi:hypothetical protein
MRFLERFQLAQVIPVVIDDFALHTKTPLQGGILFFALFVRTTRSSAKWISHEIRRQRRLWRYARQFPACQRPLPQLL